MTIMIFANVLMLVFLAGCSGTSDQTIRAYNALGRGKHLDLEEDGYIIGIEKYKREDIGAPVEGDPARFRSLPNPTASKLISQQNHEFTKATDDLKAMLVTHIASYFSERHYLFNAYNCSLKGTLNYKKGYVHRPARRLQRTSVCLR
jgi:hypothetical protein